MGIISVHVNIHDLPINKTSVPSLSAMAIRIMTISSPNHALDVFKGIKP